MDNKNTNGSNKDGNDFERERTEIFDKIKAKKTQSYSGKIVRIDDEVKRVRENDGRENPNPQKYKSVNDDSQFYRMKGGEIKSNRVRVTAPQKKKAPTAKREPDYDNPDMEIRRNAKKVKSRREGFIISGIVKVVLYISLIIAVAGILAYNVIYIANDVFAFVKDPVMKIVTIPENADIAQIGDILYENGMIEYPDIFTLYVKYKNRDRETPLKFIAGEYDLSSHLNYDEFVREFTYDRTKGRTVRITIPEGYTTDDIIDLFVSKGIGSRTGFTYAINEVSYADYGYKFIELLDAAILSQDRKYKLEGYLFPDTYDFYVNAKEIDVIKKLLANFNARFDDEFYARCDILNMSVDEVINLASIVQREAKFAEDFPKISSVFHNRLINPDFPYLESDATIQYSLGKGEPTAEDLQMEIPYNSYKSSGLPPSAICNPGREALYAALFPSFVVEMPDGSMSESTEKFYYFVHDKYGNTYYGRTNAEHEANIIRARNVE